MTHSRVDRRIQATSWSCFSILDRATVPAPVEDASEAAWREFDACWDALEQRVREQGRGTRDGDALAAGARPLEVDDVMALARSGDRVCPIAPAWRKLHLLLCTVVQARRTDPAPPPLEASQWEQATDLQKRLRLREQLAWARHHGGLAVAWEFLRALREDDWQHHTPAAWPAL